MKFLIFSKKKVYLVQGRENKKYFAIKAFLRLNLLKEDKGYVKFLKLKKKKNYNLYIFVKKIAFYNEINLMK